MDFASYVTLRLNGWIFERPRNAYNDGRPPRKLMDIPPLFDSVNILVIPAFSTGRHFQNRQALLVDNGHLQEDTKIWAWYISPFAHKKKLASMSLGRRFVLEHLECPRSWFFDPCVYPNTPPQQRWMFKMLLRLFFRDNWDNLLKSISSLGPDPSPLSGIFHEQLRHNYIYLRSRCDPWCDLRTYHNFSSLRHQKYCGTYRMGPPRYKLVYTPL